MCDVITLQIQSAPDASGKAQPPTDFATTYAAIRALTQREIDKAQLVAQQVTHLVTIPFMTGVQESMLVLLADGRLFRIEGIEDPDNRNVELRMLCVETGTNA